MVAGLHTAVGEVSSIFGEKDSGSERKDTVHNSEQYYKTKERKGKGYTRQGFKREGNNVSMRPLPPIFDA